MDPETAHMILKDDVLIPVIGGAIAVVAIIFTSVKAMVRSSNREHTRREIAAYIAEGSMTPEQGERLMAAGEAKKSCCS